MTVHTCPECCTQLSYLDAAIAYDATQPEWPLKWRLRHPIAWLYSRHVTVYARHLLDEAGK